MFATALITVAMFVWAVASSGAGSRRALMAAALCILILAVHGSLAAAGFYVTDASSAPRIAIAAPTTIAILLTLLVLAIPKGDSSLKVLTLLHTVRIPVELVLWQLFVYGYVPKVMTFESGNPDILSGLTAPLAAWIGFSGGRVRRMFLIIWNFAALVLLANIVFHAVLSVPSPFQRYGFDQPNTAVFYFPYIWLPALVAPSVLVAHIWCLRELLRKD